MRAAFVITCLVATASAKPLQKLDKVKALKQAKAAGLRQDIIVPYPVQCPKIAKPSGDTSTLASDDGLVLSLDALLRADVGVPEVVAVVGPPVLCDHEDGTQFIDMFLAAKRGDVELETKDGDLIGIIVSPEKPVVVDMNRLSKRFGASQSRMTRGIDIRPMLAPMSSMIGPSASSRVCVMFR